MGKPLVNAWLSAQRAPLANFLFAIVVFAGLFAVKGGTRYPNNHWNGYAGRFAEKAGLRAGDKILSLNSVAAKDFFELRNLIIGNKGKVDVRFDREGVEQTVHIKMVAVDDKGVEKSPSVLLALALPFRVAQN